MVVLGSIQWSMAQKNKKEPVEKAVSHLIAAMISGDRNELSSSVSDRLDRKSTRLNSSHIPLSRMPSSA